MSCCFHHCYRSKRNLNLKVVGPPLDGACFCVFLFFPDHSGVTESIFTWAHCGFFALTVCPVCWTASLGAEIYPVMRFEHFSGLFCSFLVFFLIVHYFLHVTASQYKTEVLFSDMCLCSRLEDQQHIRSNICIILGPSVQRVLKSDPMHCAFIANNISSGWGEKRLIKPSCWDVSSEESV